MEKTQVRERMSFQVITVVRRVVGAVASLLVTVRGALHEAQYERSRTVNQGHEAFPYTHWMM